MSPVLRAIVIILGIVLGSNVQDATGQKQQQNAEVLQTVGVVVQPQGRVVFSGELVVVNIDCKPLSSIVEG